MPSDKSKFTCIMDGAYVGMTCKQPVAWVRCTQFAGDHPFCDGCARKEKDFGDNSNSHHYWCAIGEY